VTKASSKVKTPSRIYWEKRESQNLQSNLKVEETYSKKVQSILEYTQDQIQKEINGFYTKYANKEGITMADAKQRVSSLDIAEYERKAEKYVAEKDFSDKANEEMRLYNATMKINRLELLKANIGLELVAGYDEMDKYMGEVLDERTLAEIRRQAGILGDGVSDPGGTAKTIAGASYRGATYSERIWTHQAMLKSELDKLLTEGMMQGRNPKVLARHLTKTFGTSKYNAERLMRTELARVQIAAQEKSYLENGWTEFEFVSIGSACSVCLALDGKHFKVKDMTIAENAPPMHPNCRCSTAPYEGGEEYEKWINSYGEHGLSFEEWKESANIQKKEMYAKKEETEMLQLAKQGNTFVTKFDQLYEYSRKIKPLEGYEDIVVHGDAYSLAFIDNSGKETNLSAKEFCDILEKSGTYKGGKIRLIACQTGAGGGIVPTYIAKHFNTEVLAPSEIVNVDFNGDMILADDPVNAKMGVETGEWVLFNAEGRVK
jgi:SPP1 gp7 family putative phage head morphogenesis protein